MARKVLFEQSAYEIAVRTQGFTGTETEFLLQLIGKDAYQVALDAGYKGTEQEWLDSLKGERGAVGPRGYKGPKGDVGPEGPQGRDDRASQCRQRGDGDLWHTLSRPLPYQKDEIGQ